MKIRASEVGRLLQCSRYKLEPLQIDTASEAAAIGTAVHAALELVAKGQRIRPAYEAAIAGLNVAEAQLSEIWAMVHTGAAMIETFRNTADLMEVHDDCSVIAERKLAVKFPESAGFEKLTGQPDLIIASPDRAKAIIIDWKTNRDASGLDITYRPQLLAYALLWAANERRAKEVTLIVAGVRHDVYFAETVTLDDLRKFAIALGKAAQDETYRIGEHCTYCRAQHTCPAILAKTQSAIRTLDNDANTIADMIRTGRFSEIWEMRKVIEKRLGAFKEAARTYIEVQGPIPLADGKQLETMTTREKTLNPNEALNLLRTVESDPARIASCFKPSVSKITDIVKERARADGRPLGKSVTTFFEMLEAEHEKRGLKMYRETTKLVTRKQKELA